MSDFTTNPVGREIGKVRLQSRAVSGIVGAVGRRSQTDVPAKRSANPPFQTLTKRLGAANPTCRTPEMQCRTAFRRRLTGIPTRLMGIPTRRNAFRQCLFAFRQCLFAFRQCLLGFGQCVLGVRQCLLGFRQLLLGVRQCLAGVRTAGPAFTTCRKARATFGSANTHRRVAGLKS